MNNGPEARSPERMHEALKPPESFQDCSFFTIRHADARYQMNERIVASETPEEPFVPGEQDLTSDLSPEGQQAAKEKAEVFLANFSPDRDALYFVSSNLVRARETAAIFLAVAKSKGFEIFQAAATPSNKVPAEIYAALGGNEIRTLESLSLNIKNMLAEFIFHPQNYLHPREGEQVHVQYPDAVSPELQGLWEQGRNIIEADNKGTWGKNFLAHGERIKALFSHFAEEHANSDVPEITTPEETHVTRFKAMLREMKTVKETLRTYEANHSKRVRVLAFTHENSLLHFLDKEFDRQGINNLEAIGYDIAYDVAGHEHYMAAREGGGNQSVVKEIAVPKPGVEVAAPK